MIPIGWWVGTAGPMTIYAKDNNTCDADVSHKDRFTSYERKKRE
jgi:hypothetical protein